jgi:hypothetical protein
MKKIIFIIAILSLLLISIRAISAFKIKRNPALATLANPIYEKLKESFSDLQTGVEYSYVSNCEYVDSTKHKMVGKIYLDGPNYIDSNNMQYIFMNNNWVIQAIHSNKYIRVYNLPTVQKQLGNNMEATFTQYLMQDSTFFKEGNFTAITKGDSLIVELVNDSVSEQVKSFKIVFAKDNKLPIYYTAKLHYWYDEGQEISLEQIQSMDAEDDANIDLERDYIDMNVLCYNIKPIEDSTIFNEEKIIVKKAGKYKLQKFSNYQ